MSLYHLQKVLNTEGSLVMIADVRYANSDIITVMNVENDYLKSVTSVYLVTLYQLQS
jgi:hypothetical protein